MTAWHGSAIRLDGLTDGDTVYVQVLELQTDLFAAFELCAYETPTCLPPANVSMYAGDTYAKLRFRNGDGTPGNAGGCYLVLAGKAHFRRPSVATADTTVIGDGNPITVWGLEPGEFYELHITQLCSDTDASNYATSEQRFSQEEAFASTPYDALRPADGDVGRINLPLTRCDGIPVTTRGATLEAGAPPACGGVADDDLWFRINVADFAGAGGADWRMIATPAPGITADLVVEYYDEDLELLACVNDAPGGGSEVYDMVGLPLEKDFFVRVYTAEAGAGADLEICVFPIRQSVLSAAGCNDALAVALDGTSSPGASGALCGGGVVRVGRCAGGAWGGLSAKPAVGE